MILLVDQVGGADGVSNLNLPLLVGLLQIVILGYLVYAFQRIARNQAETADYLRKKFGKED